MSKTSRDVIAKAQSYVGYDYHHFLDSFGIGCTAWCAAFVSVVGREACGTSITPWSISCWDQVNWFKDHGCWLGITNDVRPGDYIYYDWDHIAEAKPTDHVGIVESVNGNQFTVIEGNFGEAENYQTRVSRRVVTKGWSFIYGFARPKYDDADNTSDTSNDTPELSEGSSGTAVQTLQRLLIEKGYDCGYCGADGDFGPATKTAVIKFQADNGLTADGIVGPLTWAAAKAVKKTSTTAASPVVDPVGDEIVLTIEVHELSKGASGDDVRKLQILLTGNGYSCEVDGDYGPNTYNCVVAFQKAKGLTADGIVGPLTWNDLIYG